MRKILGARREVAPQRPRRELVGARRAPEPEIDPSRIERGQRAENCSAMISGEWFGSMIPPEPTRIVLVPPATCPITTDVAALAIPVML
ncbi:hypothetical protein ACVWW4_005906 [Bradyrhizobium sp. LB7.1]